MMIDNVLNIAIVCIGFNRIESLKRLLDSLLSAKYNVSRSYDLIISLDYFPGEPCKNLAVDFRWTFGKKKVISHTSNLGLKEHVLSCGDLVCDYDAIVILEDDLVVSPLFMEYTDQALSAYKENEIITGIALYSPPYCQNAQRIFHPIQTAFSSYFMQFPCSWGQVWTKKQWYSFRSWYDSKNVDLIHPDLPRALKKWSNQSWLKIFASYGLFVGKTWVHPYNSLTTNMAAIGVHFSKKASKVSDDLLYQVRLLHGEGTSFHFPQLGETIAEYDIYHENCSPLFMKQIGVDANEVEFDLYGMKPLNSYRKPKLITSKSVRKTEKSYGLVMKPQEENILSNVKGNYFALAQKEDILDRTKRKLNWYLFTYWVGGTFSLMDMLRLSWERFKIRVGL